MKIAYIIICHRNNNIIRELIKQINEDADIYVHVDKKSNINDFIEYKGRVNFIDKRVDVKWGHYSQVEATLNLMEETNKYKYDYVFLLSGDCLPIKSCKKINNFLKKNNGVQYVAQDYNYRNIDDRLKYNYPSVYFKKNKNIADKIIINLHRVFKCLFRNKYYKNLPTLYKGTQWFGITGELNQYILEYVKANPEYVKAFKKSLCSDEVFFHTIIFNSKFKDNLYIPQNKSNICYQAVRYIDWKKGPDYPRTLDESDFDDIKNTECLFARKFNNNINLEKYRNELINN